MNYKNPNTDSGGYVNGVYTTKNGYSGSGLNCPKGTRLYDIGDENIIKPIFFAPDDLQPGEVFKPITKEVAPDILPYYAVSNYGRVENIITRKVMKPNYRPNGYEYLCLAADNCKNGQKKYTTHRLVLKTFDPRDNMDELQTNHIYGDKTKNYINKLMPDGSYDTSIEWSTPSENAIHRNTTMQNVTKGKLNMEEATKIRSLHDQGYSYQQISKNFYNDYISSSTVQLICQNKTYKDENYTPKEYIDSYKLNPANLHRLTDEDADKIKDLYNHGYTAKEIRDHFYSNFSVGAIFDIVKGRTHNR